jgi:hypothetical protein
MNSHGPNDVSPEAMQARIQQARREAETLKDRIKRKKDELADTTREPPHPASIPPDVLRNSGLDSTNLPVNCPGLLTHLSRSPPGRPADSRTHSKEPVDEGEADTQGTSR